MSQVVLALALAYVAAAPQLLLRSAAVLDNEGAKQIGLPFSNGWTDGPNNGIGPVVHAYAAPVLHSSVVHTPWIGGAHHVVL